MNIEDFRALPWAEQRELMSHWKHKELRTYKEIGEELSVSRSAVAGMCYRFRLKLTNEEYRLMLLKRGRNHYNRTTPRSNLRTKSTMSNPSPDRKVKIHKKSIPLPTASETWEALPGTMPVRIMDMHNKGQCRWPIGHHTHTVCGLPTEEGSSYCETHTAVAFKPLTVLKDMEKAYGRS